jgi:hypothetical protein
MTIGILSDEIITVASQALINAFCVGSFVYIGASEVIMDSFARFAPVRGALSLPNCHGLTCIQIAKPADQVSCLATRGVSHGRCDHRARRSLSLSPGYRYRPSRDIFFWLVHVPVHVQYMYMYLMTASNPSWLCYMYMYVL